MNKEKLATLNELIRKRAFYLGVLNDMHTRKYKDSSVESALENCISDVVSEITDIIWELFSESIGLDTRDENFEEKYESFTDRIDIFVRYVNSYEKYGIALYRPIPVGFFEEIMDELILDFEWTYPCRSCDSMVNILWDSELCD